MPVTATQQRMGGKRGKSPVRMKRAKRAPASSEKPASEKSFKRRRSGRASEKHCIQIRLLDGKQKWPDNCAGRRKQKKNRMRWRAKIRRTGRRMETKIKEEEEKKMTTKKKQTMTKTKKMEEEKRM